MEPSSSQEVDHAARPLSGPSESLGHRETGGKGGGFDLGSRCGREKESHDQGGSPSFRGPLVG